MSPRFGYSSCRMHGRWIIRCNRCKRTLQCGYPFHQQTYAQAGRYIGFNYEAFYKGELDKKHQDRPYRYFNTINLLESSPLVTPQIKCKYGAPMA